MLLWGSRTYYGQVYAQLISLQQSISSEPSEQCITPSQTRTLRIQAPVVVHLKSSAAKHSLLSGESSMTMQRNYAAFLSTVQMYHIQHCY